ncbi:magnesium chelatase subunit D [Jannaschia sp. Os4]|nr:magnesium chelatase subunit D [Jannaschia sp. Os4]
MEARAAHEAHGARWARAALALRCLHVDPGLGAHLRARAGPVRDLWCAGLPAPQVRLHPDIGDEALLGGLDLTATLEAGRPIHRAGLLARDGLLVLPMAERCAPALAGRLARALDDGRALVALDEGEEATAPAALLDRLAFHLDLDGLPWGAVADPLGGFEPHGTPRMPDDAAPRLVQTAFALGIASLRAPALALRVARAAAVATGGDVTDDHLRFAVETVLAPRATRLPEAEEADAPPPPPVEPREAGGESAEATGPAPDRLLDAARAVLPEDLLARLASTHRSSGDGSGAARRDAKRGRPLPPRPGRRDGRRLDLLATLRAAAPWQRLRGGSLQAGLKVRAADFRWRRHEDRSERLVVFVVDASGSAAAHRLAEAKGAVELLLAEAYAKRDQVALVGFRGHGAEVLLPPTRSLVRTKRRLAGLPGGGGTPLAAGLEAALTLSLQARRHGLDPALVLMTDGRPNVARDGTPGRPQAWSDAEAMSRLVRSRGVPALVVDTGTRPTPQLRDLAGLMDGPCIPLPRADKGRLVDAL